MTDESDLLRQAAECAPKVLPKVIGGYVRREIAAAERTVYKGLAHLYPEIVDEAYVLARAVLALPVPAPAVDREGLIRTVANVLCDNHECTNGVDGPRPSYDSDANALIDALIDDGLIRATGTAGHAGEAPRG